MAQQQSFFGTEAFVDSEDLMSWLLLNPDLDTSQWNNNNTYDPFNNAPQQNVGYELRPNAEEQLENGFRIGFAPPVSQVYDARTMINMQQQQQMAMNQKQIGQPTTMPNANSMQAMDLKIPGKKPVAAVSAAAAKAAAKKRPRESIEDLEARVNELKAENADLHAHLLNVTQRTTEVQKQRASMERLMTTKLAELGEKNDTDQTELAQIVKQYTDIYADYGKCRQREVAFHLQRLEKLIVPTKTTKMCLWTLHQDKVFYQRNKSPMYDILCKELEITPEQTEKIQERREKITNLLSQLSECLDLLQSLKQSIERKHCSYDSVCGRVQNAANPKQIVKFLIWITTNAELLAKYIPGFSRTIHHVPHIQIVEKLGGFSTDENGGGGSSSSNAGGMMDSMVGMKRSASMRAMSGAGLDGPAIKRSNSMKSLQAVTSSSAGAGGYMFNTATGNITANTINTTSSSSSYGSTSYF